jgi:hypothetical protein
MFGSFLAPRLGPLPAGFITFCEVYTFPAGAHSAAPRLRPTVSRTGLIVHGNQDISQQAPRAASDGGDGGYLKRETERASPFFCGDLLEHSVVEHRLGQKLLQLCVLVLERP